MSKKILSALLAVMLVLALVPMAAFAEESVGEDSIITAFGGSEYVELKDGVYALKQDATLTETLKLLSAEDIVIDLAGHTITCTGSIQVQAGSLTVRNSVKGNGKLSGASTAVIWVMGSATGLTIEDDVTVESTGAESYAIAVWNDVSTKATITIAGALTATGTDGNGLTVNGLVGEDYAPTINVTGDITAIDCGMYLAGPANTTVTGIIASNVGIEIRAGELEVNGATIIGGAEAPSSDSNGNGSTSHNAGIAVAQHTTGKDITVNVTNGAVVRGGSALYVTNPEDNIISEGANLSVTVEGGETVLGATHSDTNNAVYNNSPVEITITGAKIEGNVKLVQDTNNGTAGNIAIEEATVNGDITGYESNPGAVTVKDSTIDGVITAVGVVAGCIDGSNEPIADVSNSNPSLTLAQGTDDAAFLGMCTVEIGGAQAGKLYIVRIAESAAFDETSVIIPLDGDDIHENGYSFGCKSGKHVTLWELGSLSDVNQLENGYYEFDPLTEKTLVTAYGQNAG